MVLLFGYATLWKQDKIRLDYAPFLRLLVIVFFVKYVMYMPNDLWNLRSLFANSEYTQTYSDISNAFSNKSYLFSIINLILPLLTIYSYNKFLKTPSTIPIEDTDYIVSNSYCPTKIEIGFLISVVLFIGLILLSFLFV